MTFIEPPRPERLLYIFAKPPPETARLIDRVRRARGLGACYAPERLHITLARLGDSDDIPPATFARIDHAVEELRIEPFSVRFDAIHQNMLVGTYGLRKVRAVQRTLERGIVACGVPLMPRKGRPHVSLAYDTAFQPDVAIAPIEWQVDSLLLVVSHQGQGRHQVLRRWSLVTRQFLLPFAA